MARRRGSERALRGGGWALAGLAVLALADVALVALALSSTRADARPSTATAPSLPVPTGAATATPTPAPSSTPTTTPSPSVAAVGVALGAVDDTVAYRAVTGTCPQTAALLEVTSDGGATWSSATPADARSIQAISATPAEVSIVAADPGSCAPAAYRSFVQGADWQLADDLGTRWYLDAGRVVSPAGVPPAPCEAPVQLAARSSNEAAVLCDDATVSVTADSGTTWTRSAPVQNVVAVASAADGYLVAAAGLDGCAGAQVLPLAADLAPGTPGACVAAEAAPGATVISAAANGVLWLWSGDVVARSSDGGATW